jgi:hypothetical protein
LKGESRTAFETALEDARVDPDPNNPAPLALTLEHIGEAMDQVAMAVFPHRALEIQKLWMNRGMRKPYDLSTRNTAAAITRINNCIPLFPNGTPEAKFIEQELIGLLEWSLPQAWRKKFDLEGYIPTLGTKAKLISKCEAIERSDMMKERERKDDNNNNNKNKKNQFGKSAAGGRKDDRGNNGSFYCSRCGRNRTHGSASCYFLKDKTQRFEKKNLNRHEEMASKNNPPFSRRTFRKEVNSLARKAGKKKALNLYASALKREQAKESKAKKAKKKEVSSDDSSESGDSIFGQCH